MEVQYLLLIGFATLAVVMSFLCSLWESVLLSITPSFALVEEERGTRIGHRLLAFKNNIDRPLSAILTLNTIAHTVGAIGVGNQASLIWQETNPLITAFAVPVLMTLAILVLSEIIPKTLGANYWRELAGFTVVSLVLLLKVLAPLVWMTEWITRSLRRDVSGSILSRNELTAIAAAGVKEGVLQQWESDFISNLMRFHAIQARDIMTPRTVTRMADAAQTFGDFQRDLDDIQFSRIPLQNYGDEHAVIGYILRSEALQRIAEGAVDDRLDSIRRDMPVVNETESIERLLVYFLERREHMALVVDQYDGIRGVLTLEDVIETMLGLEIVDELDAAEDMQALARENWKRRARSRGIAIEGEPMP